MQPLASSRTACQAASALPPSPLRGSGAVFASDRLTISDSRSWAPATSSATNAVSGMFFQYFFGISFSIAFVFSRAGLKIAA